MFYGRSAADENDSNELTRQAMLARLRAYGAPAQAWGNSPKAQTDAETWNAGVGAQRADQAKVDASVWGASGDAAKGAVAASLTSQGDQAIAALKNAGDTQRTGMVESGENNRNAASIAGNLTGIDKTQAGETARTGMTERGASDRNAASIAGNLAGIDKTQAGETGRTVLTEKGAFDRNAASIAGNLQGIDRTQAGENYRTGMTTGSAERVARGNQQTQQTGDVLGALSTLGRPDPITGQANVPRGLLETLAARGGAGGADWSSIPEPGSFSADDEALIAKGVDADHSRADVIAYLRKNGKIK